MIKTGPHFNVLLNSSLEKFYTTSVSPLPATQRYCRLLRWHCLFFHNQLLLTWSFAICQPVDPDPGHRPWILTGLSRVCTVGASLRAVINGVIHRNCTASFGSRAAAVMHIAKDNTEPCGSYLTFYLFLICRHRTYLETACSFYLSPHLCVTFMAKQPLPPSLSFLDPESFPSLIPFLLF